MEEVQVHNSADIFANANLFRGRPYEVTEDKSLLLTGTIFREPVCNNIVRIFQKTSTKY